MPLKYIKVRAHGKKERDFGRLFLAQELRGRTGVEIAQSGGRLPNAPMGVSRSGESRKDGDAVWTMEFSKDGKYLAAGGKDNIVRVWAVLATKADREAHEEDEENAAGDSIRLNAPVFKTQTVQEYSGHTSSILDLSWSKVGSPVSRCSKKGDTQGSDKSNHLLPATATAVDRQC